MKNKIKLPVFLEFTLVSVGIITTILIIYTIIQLISLNFFSIDYQKEQIRNKYDDIELLLSYTNLKEDNLVSLKDFMKEREEIIRIYQDETIKYFTPSKVWEGIPLSGESVKLKTYTKFIEFKRYIILDAPISINNANYRIQILQSESIFNDFIESYFSTFIFALLIGLVLSIIGAIYVTRRFLNRLKVLTDTMKEIKDKGMERRVEISRKNDEFDKVNIIFNTMMDDLQDSFDKQSRFIADASHELRTPLTALQGHLSMIQRWGKYDEERSEKSIRICLDEVGRLTKIVKDLLVLSKSDNIDFDINKIKPIDPRDIITDTIENYKILKDKVEFNVDIQEKIKFKIREEHLKQLLIIFIENAIKYNDKEKVIIDISLYVEKDKVILSVKDNGIGIPKDEIPFIMDRFYRVDKSRIQLNKSFGLGLSIAKRIVESYKGKIIISSEVGRGTEIKVEI